MDLYGKIINLRSIEESDMKFMHDIFNDKDISKYQVKTHFSISMVDQMKWFNNRDSKKELRYIIENKNHAKIGVISLTDIDWVSRKAEISIKTIFDSKIRVKNDVYEAVNLLLDYSFNELNLNLIETEILDEHIFSKKLVIKCGFSKEAVLKDRVYRWGKYHDLVIFSIFSKDYNKKYQEVQNEK